MRILLVLFIFLSVFSLSSCDKAADKPASEPANDTAVDLAEEVTPVDAPDAASLSDAATP